MILEVCFNEVFFYFQEFLNRWWGNLKSRHLGWNTFVMWFRNSIDWIIKIFYCNWLKKDAPSSVWSKPSESKSEVMQHQCSLFTPVQNASEKGFVCNDASISRAAALCLFMLFAKRTNNESKLNSFLAHVLVNLNNAYTKAKLKRTKRPKLQQIHCWTKS